MVTKVWPVMPQMGNYIAFVGISMDG